MSRLQTHALDADILVAGGGPAGFACALSAARLGARVILCQDRPVLGGNASSEVRMHIVGATGLRDGIPLRVENREGGIIEELRLDLACRNPQRSASMLDLLLYEKCRAEPNLTLLLNTTVVGAELSVDRSRIERAIAERQSTEDQFVITAKTFVDCTGDSRLAAEAGAAFRHGREGQAEFGESLATPTADGKTLGSTLLFQARKHDRPMPFTAPPWARKFTRDDFKFRPFGKPGSDLGLEYGYWWLEWGGGLDTIKDNERIRDELLAILLGVWNYIKNESELDASHWALEWFGFLPGKRESRRCVGQYVLTEQDLLLSRAFPDAIAFGGWPIDTHPPGGVDAPDEAPCDQHHLPYLYSIPLRACVAAGVRNLMFAGRNISATHIAFASTRVMATCAVVGQGVGTAAALALREAVDPAAASARPELMSRIQQRLLRDDCYLVGVCNAEVDDLARNATVSASSEQPGGRAAQVLSGQTRAVHGPWDEASIRAALASPVAPKFGANLWDEVLRKVERGGGPADLTIGPPDRCFPGTHRWMSEPAAGFPAWIELRWPAPVRLSEIILVFDTGMHRHLTQSQADGYTQRMVWGRPQPETVRDYAVEVHTSGAWRVVARETGNYQRRRSHRFAAIEGIDAVRLRVEATNGLDHARVFEIRAYA